MAPADVLIPAARKKTACQPRLLEPVNIVVTRGETIPGMLPIVLPKE
jgi:hypothetical protein